MNDYLKKTVVKLLRETANRIEIGNSEMSDEEAMSLFTLIGHRAMSKEQVCKYLNLSRSRFDDLVREKKMPKGRKRVGFKELVWYQDEIDECLKLL